MGLQQAKDAGENRDGKVSQTDSVLLCVHEIPGTLSLSFFLSSLLPRVPRYLQSALVRVCSFLISLSGSSRAARRYFCFWLFDEHSTTLTLSTRAPFRRAHFQLLIASFHPWLEPGSREKSLWRRTHLESMLWERERWCSSKWQLMQAPPLQPSSYRRYSLNSLSSRGEEDGRVPSAHTLSVSLSLSSSSRHHLMQQIQSCFGHFFLEIVLALHSAVRWNPS